LIRLQVHDGRLTIGERPGAGRSTYLCPDPECLDRALKRGAFRRSLRTDVTIPDRFNEEFGRAVAAGREVR